MNLPLACGWVRGTVTKPSQGTDLQQGPVDNNKVADDINCEGIVQGSVAPDLWNGAYLSVQHKSKFDPAHKNSFNSKVTVTAIHFIYEYERDGGKSVIKTGLGQ